MTNTVRRIRKKTKIRNRNGLKKRFTPSETTGDDTKIKVINLSRKTLTQHEISMLVKGPLKAFKQLKFHTDIVIKKADKGSMFVVLDTEFYRDKLVLHDHLNTDTYEIIPSNTDNKVMKNLNLLINKHRKCLYEQGITYINNKKWKSSNIYVTPKVHKSKTIIEMCKTTCSEYVHMPVPADLKGRPIIAGPVAPTQRLSELIEKLLSPLVMFLRSFIKDDWDFIRNIPPSVNFECDLFSVNIVSLYTNIPHSLGVEAISYYFDKYRDKIPRRCTKEFMIESTLFILNNNNFFFDEVCYHQKEGTAMGTKFAPPYACLSVGYLEETKLYVQLPWHFADSTCELIIRWFLRHIDDGFILWPRDLDIDTFFTILNNLNTNIQ